MGMREKLIDIVEAYADFLDWDTKDNMVDSIMELLATDNNVGYKWIPVTERLPNTFGEYIVAAKDAFGEVYTDYADYDPFRKSWKTGLFLDKGEGVTHWMPLPEPPKGE